MTGIETKAIISAFLLAFGIVAPIPDLAAGLALAIGGCYAVMIVSTPSTRTSLWATIFLGVLAAVFAAILHDHLAFVNKLPLQAVMGAAGALSKFIVEAAISFGHGLKEWAGGLPKNWKGGGK